MNENKEYEINKPQIELLAKTAHKINNGPVRLIILSNEVPSNLEPNIPEMEEPSIEHIKKPVKNTGQQTKEPDNAMT